MLIGGKKLNTSNEKVVPIIRKDGNYYFILEMVHDVEGLNKMIDGSLAAVEPVFGGAPGERMKPVETRSTREREDQRFNMWQDGMVVRSLLYCATPSKAENGTTVLEKHPVEWEIVNIDDPKTWNAWRSELATAGLNQYEIDRMFTSVLEVNALTESTIQAALDDFLAIPLVVPNGTIQKEEASITPSGDPVSDSESDLPE